VEPGVYYLSVREHHDPATGPVEKPTDWYLLTVRLVDPVPGEELEPNDGPDRSASRFERYAEWRATAVRNRLGEGAPVRGDTAPDDPDLFAVEPRDAREAPEVVLAVPEPGLALEARLWIPDAEDLAASASRDRVRFEDAAEGGPGEVLVVRLGKVPAPGEPALLLLKAAEGSGRYQVVALGRGPGSGAAALALLRELAGAARIATALEVAGAFASELPEAPGRAEVLRAAAEIAARAAPTVAPEEVRASFARASLLLGASAFEVRDGKVRPGAAFEPWAAGTGAGGR
jgi:hypothetical protein